MKCKICGLNETEILQTEYRDTRTYTVLYCNRCDIVQTAEQYDEFSPDYAQLTSNDLNSEHLWLQGLHKKPAYFQFMSAFLKLTNWDIEAPMKLLDIGCGTGGFLNFAKFNGFYCLGFDASAAQAAHARSQHENVRCATSVTEYLNLISTSEKINVITMWDVLEHIREPHSFLGEVANVMEADTILFVSVPNGACARLKAKVYPIFGRKYSFDPWEHVFYYSLVSLKRILEESGFRVVVSGSVVCYPRQLSLFEIVRRTGFRFNRALVPRLSPQIFVFAEQI